MQIKDFLISIVLALIIFNSINPNFKNIVIPIAIIALVIFVLYSNDVEEHMTSLSNEAIQDIASVYNNLGTLTVPNLNVTGTVTVGGQTTLNGSTTISQSGSLNVNGPATFAGQTALNGTSTVNGAMSVSSGGSLYIHGDKNFGADVQCHNGSSTNSNDGGHRGCNFYNIFG